MARVCQRCAHANTDEAKFCLQCGAMLEVDAPAGGDPLIGKILMGRYRIVEVLGEGGMGKVYKAEQKMGAATRKVAIKTLLPELSNDPQIVARFHRECETVIELHHPNTVQFYDFGELEDRTLFIVMELIQGEDLSHVLARGPVDPGRAEKIIIQICGSLNEAHHRGIVHRDLKPENVLLTERGGQSDFVKVLDFGIAKRNEAEDAQSAKLTKQGMVLGTPPYMSPEQFSGQALDARSDIYSLGVMTYEMLTGSLPFSAKTPWEWATMHLTAEPTPIESYAEGTRLDERKRAVIRQALAKNRDHRPPTVLDFMHGFTGLADAQQAWTLATSAGLSRVSGASATPSGQMPTTGTVATNPTLPATNMTPKPMPAHGTGAHATFDTGSLQAAGLGGIGKLVAAAVVGLMVLGGAALGGVWWWTQRPSARADLGTSLPAPTTPMLPTTGATGVPSTPPLVGEDGKPVPAAPTPPDTGTELPTGAEAPSGTASNDAPDPNPAEDPDARDDADDDPHPSGHRSGPSPAEVQRAQTLVAQATAAAQRNDLDAAAHLLQQAARAVPRRHAVIRAAIAEIGRRGSNRVGILMQQGHCADAQALYRTLRTAGAEGPSRSHFSGDWCPRP